MQGAHSVWVVGDSIVRWASQDLNLPNLVRWNGRGGAQLKDLHGLLSGFHATSPALIILHLGTNDLVSHDLFTLRQLITSALGICRQRFPQAIVVWSDILPRMFYFGATSQKAIENVRKAANRWAKAQCKKLGARVLQHPQFIWSDASLYRFDGVHLSPKGIAIFRANLCNCILSVL